MVMTRISDVIVPGGITPSRYDLGDVLTDGPPPIPATVPNDANVQPSHSDLLRNALAIDAQIAAAKAGQVT